MSFLFEMLGEVVIEIFFGYTGAYFIRLSRKEDRPLDEIILLNPRWAPFLGFLIWAGIIGTGTYFYFATAR